MTYWSVHPYFSGVSIRTRTLAAIQDSYAYSAGRFIGTGDDQYEDGWLIGQQEASLSARPGVVHAAMVKHGGTRPLNQHSKTETRQIVSRLRPIAS